MIYSVFKNICRLGREKMDRVPGCDNTLILQLEHLEDRGRWILWMWSQPDLQSEFQDSQRYADKWFLKQPKIKEREQKGR